MNIDEWAAEQCGVDIKKYGNHFFYIPEGKIHQQREWWTIKDPRCQKIFRNWWLGDEWSGRKVTFTSRGVRYEQPNSTDGRGSETVAYEPTEEACITAIYEAQKNE